MELAIEAAAEAIAEDRGAMAPEDPPLMGTDTTSPPYTSVLLKPKVFWKMQDFPV